MSVDDLVRRLVAEPPEYMTELEELVGLIGARISMSFVPEDKENAGYLWRPRLGAAGEFARELPLLSVRYRFDFHHERPERPRNVWLTEYTLHLRGDRATAEALLAARFGRPGHAMNGALEYALYPPFYIATGGRGDYLLEWCAERPRWSLAIRPAAVREQFLIGLRDCIAAARSIDDLDAYCRRTAANAGVVVKGTYNKTLNHYAEFEFPYDDTRDYHLRFAPPIKASLIAEVFGWYPAIGMSGDVHMSTWDMQRRNDDWYPTSGAAQHWELRATLTGWPSGAALDTRRGACIPRLIGDEDEVEHFSVQPRFR